MKDVTKNFGKNILDTQIKISNQLPENFQRIALSFERISSEFRQNINPILEKLNKSAAHALTLEASDWVPHYTIPPNIIESKTISNEQISANLEEYYIQCWSDIQDEVLSNFNSYKISNFSKEILVQVLWCHENKYYASVVRTLFPQIESMIRDRLKLNIRKPDTSQKQLRKRVGDLAPSQVNPGGLLALNLYKLIDRHIYEHVGAENKVFFESSSIPNRHAVVHGIIEYNSLKNSLNTIFLYDYIAQVITVLEDG